MKTKCWKCKRDLPNIEAMTEEGCVFCDVNYAKKYKSIKRRYDIQMGVKND